MKFLKTMLGVMSPIHFYLVKNFARGTKYMGSDDFGNKYFRANPRAGYNRERRWVLYAKTPEASAIPPEWHGWLHYQTNAVPGKDTLSFRRPWQLPHRPNMTGSTLAYRPPGHLLEGGKRPKTTGDYEAWTPDADRP